MSEAAIQTALQTLIRAMTAYEDNSVTINDWSILDNLGEAHAPFCIIGSSDNFMARQDTQEANTRWDMPITIFEAFTGWQATLAGITLRRQALVDMINTAGTNRSVGTSEITIDAVRNDGLVEPYYDPYLDPDQIAIAEPIYLRQRIVLEVEEF